MARDHRTEYGEKTCTEKELIDLHTRTLFLQLRKDQHMHVEKLSEAQEKTLERIKEKNPQGLSRAGNHVPAEGRGVEVMHRESRTQRSIASVVQQNQAPTNG